MRAYITGTSTRKVDQLVKALGCDSGVSRSTVSRICKAIDDDVAVLRGRRLDHLPFVYVWLDATYVNVREHGQVISKAVVIATGVRTDGHREVLGVDIGDSENETFWTEFLRDLKDRGLDGVRLVVSDAHVGLRAAIRRVFQGTGWQRCRVHATRNLLGHCKHQHRGMVAALIRTIFAQPDAATARHQLHLVVDQLTTTEPKVAQLLEEMADDLLAYATFPPVHWSKIWSNNPIERLNRELKRRTDVVQIFPRPRVRHQTRRRAALRGQRRTRRRHPPLHGRGHPRAPHRRQRGTPTVHPGRHGLTGETHGPTPPDGTPSSLARGALLAAVGGVERPLAPIQPVTSQLEHRRTRLSPSSWKVSRPQFGHFCPRAITHTPRVVHSGFTIRAAEASRGLARRRELASSGELAVDRRRTVLVAALLAPAGACYEMSTHPGECTHHTQKCRPGPHGVGQRSRALPASLPDSPAKCCANEGAAASCSTT